MRTCLVNYFRIDVVSYGGIFRLSGDSIYVLPAFFEGGGGGRIISGGHRVNCGKTNRRSLRVWVIYVYWSRPLLVNRLSQNAV